MNDDRMSLFKEIVARLASKMGVTSMQLMLEGASLQEEAQVKEPSDDEIESFAASNEEVDEQTVELLKKI